MKDFGHFGRIGRGVCVDAWGAGPFQIRASDGRVYRFEDSDQFGPALVKKNGDPLANPWPSKRSPFWHAHWLWKRQGRKTRNGVTCIWRGPWRGGRQAREPDTRHEVTTNHPGVTP